MLDLVITHYQEEWGVGEKLFRMIGLQRCIDFNDLRVTVINDGGHRLPEEKLMELPYPVKQHDIPHGGISAARNAGIDIATEEWIMFCDFDDSLCSVYSMREYLSCAKGAKEFDMLWTRIMAEDYVNGKEMLYTVPEKQRFVFCHGKLYRTAFLRESGIRFEEDLTFNEDSCFNAMIVAKTPHTRIGEIKSPFPLYTWIRRENSVTNSGREDEAAYGHFRRNLKVTDENRKSRGGDFYTGMLTRTVYDTYYMVFGKRISTRMKRKIVEEFAPWVAEKAEAFGKVTKENMAMLMSVAKSELLDQGENVPDDPKLVKKWMDGLIRTAHATEDKRSSKGVKKKCLR